MMFLLRFFTSALLVQTVFGAPEGVGKDITNSTKGLRFTIGTSEYTVLPELFSWLLAKYACKELGMELVSIESAEENTAITQNIAEIYKNEYFWTSGVRVGTFNEYYWESTGTFFGPYTNWDSTSPTFDDMLMYVEFNTFLNPGAEIKWNDFYANYGRMALCELRAQTYDTSVKTKPGLFRIGDGFYEISPIKLPWHHAKNDCRSKGMDLLSIETEEENIALIAALQEYVENFWTSGSRYDTQDYVWQATGQLIANTFTNWAEGEPGAFCGLKINNNTQTRQWISADCYAESELARYVCEFHPRK